MMGIHTGGKKTPMKNDTTTALAKTAIMLRSLEAIAVYEPRDLHLRLLAG